MDTEKPHSPRERVPISTARSALARADQLTEPAKASRPRPGLRVDQASAPGSRTRGMEIFPGLDILRGIAATTIVVYHSIHFFEWTSFPTTNPLALWFRVGWIGVDLFFVISGLVIASSALSLWERKPELYTREYLNRRLSRIVPLHYLTCLLYLLFIIPGMVKHPQFWWHAVTHLTFLHGFSPLSMGSIDGPNWSLAIEIQFYLLILFLAPFLMRFRPLYVVAGSIAIGCAWRAVVFALVHGRTTREGINLTWFGVSQLPGMLDHFGFGVALAMVFHGDTSGRVRAFLRKTRWLWPVATAAAAYAVMSIYWPRSELWHSWKMVVFWRTLLAGTCLMAVITACAIHDRWFLRLAWPLRYLGTISYGIYLWHSLVIMSFKPVFPGEPQRAFLWTMAMTLILASLSWHFLEKPMMARFRKAS